MFRNKIIKLKSSGLNASTSSGDTTPVFQSRSKTQQQHETENQIVSSQEASQNFTQNAPKSRFLSQRQALLNATQHQKSIGKGPLEIILFSCGLEITEMGCELEKGDPITFTRRLRVLLTSKPDYPHSTRQYIHDFHRDFLLTDEEKSIKCEKLMRGIIMSDGQKQYQTQTSLIMCLLAIKCFKDDVVKILLHRLKEYVIEKDDKAEALIISLVLAQFKFSDQILSDELYNYMFEEFFAIFNELKTFETQEVIVQQFKELQVEKQEESARRLVSMFKHKKQDLLKFLDIFCLMALDDQTITDIFEIVLRYIENDCSSSQYLPMIKYSIHYSKTVEDVVDILRDQVKWETCSNNVINDVFKIIKKSLIRDSNKTIEAWTKTVEIVNATSDLRYIDIIMLLLIADTNTEVHLSAVKKIVLDKISKGLFTNSYLKNSFKIFAAIIPSISQTSLELLDGLQRAKDNQTYQFLATCYKLLFRFSGESKIIIGSLTNFLCEKKSNLPFASSSEFKMTILNILHDILNDSPKSAADLLFNHKILLRALDISRVELTLNEHRLLMKLFSLLVYGVDYGTLFKAIEMRTINEVKDTLSEHLNMVNCKYINNPEVKIRQLGIIGAVKIISCLIFDKVDESEITPETVIPPEDMRDGSAIKDASRLVELILTAADKNYEMLAMFYDEMSLELKSSGSSSPRIISQTFLNWFGNETFRLVRKIVATEVDTEFITDFTFVRRFENVDDSYESPELTVPIGSMLAAGRREILILPSLFKLTLLIEIYRYGNNDIKQVAGLCAMGICLTEKFATSDDVLNDDKETARIQLDTYFLCCNWMRELISGFIQSKDESILKLVKSRLKQLIKVERHLNRLLKSPLPSGYCPPMLNVSLCKSFEALTKEKVVLRPPKIRKKSDKTVEVAPKKTLKIKSSTFCREMENDVVFLLKEEFLFDTIRIENEKYTLTELIYVLEDVHCKLEMLFKPRKVEQQKFIGEMKAIRDLEIAVLPHLTRVFEGINDQIKKSMSNQHEESLESVKVLKLSSKGFSMILQMFNMIFSSKKLQKDETLMSALLKKLLTTDTSRLRSQELVCAAVFEKYSKFSENARDLNGSVALIDLLGIVSSSSGERHHYSAPICEMAEYFLHQKWENDGSNFNSKLERLLSIYVNKATNVDQLEELIDEVEGFCKNNQEKHFPSINKTNFICMIRVYLRRTTELINSTKSSSMSFTFWQKIATIQCKFVDAVKWQKSAMALNLFLKNFIVFLKRFNIDGISVLRAVAKENINNFVDLMKNMQRIRRSAHGAACELKHRKNVSISKILPSVRQQLESFYQEASIIMCNANVPMSAIHDGPLKNFDICMEDIFSQNTTVASTNGSVNENVSEEEKEEEEEKNDDDDDSIAANMDTSDSEDESSFVRNTRSRSTIL